MPDFSPSLAELARTIDEVLIRFLEDKSKRLTSAGLLVEEVTRITLAGGKRIRPAFCYWGYRAAGGRDDDVILPVAAALELLHTFALVHDDIIDASVERRGADTINAKHGPDVALLAGDLALVFADDLLLRSPTDAASLRRALFAYSTMRQEVIAGQYLDVDAKEGEVDEDLARRIAVLKTGRYSVVGPLRLGAALGGEEEDLSRALGRFGERVGEAFQLRDDVLGTFGDRAELGKSADSDRSEGKKNIVYAKAVENLGGDDLKWFRATWGSGGPIDDSDRERLLTMLEATGVRSEIEALIDGLHRDALDELSSASIDDASRVALSTLAERAVERST